MVSTEWLKKTELFETLNESQLNILLAHSEVRRCTEGETIFKQGEDAIFILLEELGGFLSLRKKENACAQENGQDTQGARLDDHPLSSLKGILEQIYTDRPVLSINKKSSGMGLVSPLSRPRTSSPIPFAFGKKRRRRALRRARD